ncbi:MAG: hypothetical protein P9L88_01420 [Candidatus Tantalella remota]|nr:hypothetical protein [Candidatus Tantalella remota]
MAITIAFVFLFNTIFTEVSRGLSVQTPFAPIMNPYIQFDIGAESTLIGILSQINSGEKLNDELMRAFEARLTPPKNANGARYTFDFRTETGKRKEGNNWVIPSSIELDNVTRDFETVVSPGMMIIEMRKTRPHTIRLKKPDEGAQVRQGTGEELPVISHQSSGEAGTDTHQSADLSAIALAKEEALAKSENTRKSTHTGALGQVKAFWNDLRLFVYKRLLLKYENKLRELTEATKIISLYTLKGVKKRVPIPLSIASSHYDKKAARLTERKFTLKRKIKELSSEVGEGTEARQGTGEESPVISHHSSAATNTAILFNILYDPALRGKEFTLEDIAKHPLLLETGHTMTNKEIQYSLAGLKFARLIHETERPLPGKYRTTVENEELIEDLKMALAEMNDDGLYDIRESFEGIVWRKQKKDNLILVSHLTSEKSASVILDHGFYADAGDYDGYITDEYEVNTIPRSYNSWEPWVYLTQRGRNVAIAFRIPKDWTRGNGDQDSLNAKAGTDKLPDEVIKALNASGIKHSRSHKSLSIELKNSLTNGTLVHIPAELIDIVWTLKYNIAIHGPEFLETPIGKKLQAASDSNTIKEGTEARQGTGKESPVISHQSSETKKPAAKKAKGKEKRTVKNIDELKSGQIVHFTRKNTATGKTIYKRNMEVESVLPAQSEVVLRPIDTYSGDRTHSYFTGTASIVKDEIVILEENGTAACQGTSEGDPTNKETPKFTDFKEHDEVYHWIKDKVKSGEWKDTYTLINFDFHADDHSLLNNGLDNANWVEYLKKEYLIGTYAWIHHPESFINSRLADIRTSDLEFGLPSSKRPVIITFDMDYFIPYLSDDEKPSKGDIDANVKAVVDALASMNYDIKGINITRSPVEIHLDLEEYLYDRLRQELRRLENGTEARQGTGEADPTAATVNSLRPTDRRIKPLHEEKKIWLSEKHGRFPLGKFHKIDARAYFNYLRDTLGMNDLAGLKFKLTKNFLGEWRLEIYSVYKKGNSGPRNLLHWLSLDQRSGLLTNVNGKKRKMQREISILTSIKEQGYPVALPLRGHFISLRGKLWSMQKYYTRAGPYLPKETIIVKKRNGPNLELRVVTPGEKSDLTDAIVLDWIEVNKDGNPLNSSLENDNKKMSFWKALTDQDPTIENKYSHPEKEVGPTTYSVGFNSVVYVEIKRLFRYLRRNTKLVDKKTERLEKLVFKLFDGKIFIQAVVKRRLPDGKSVTERRSHPSLGPINLNENGEPENTRLNRGKQGTKYVNLLTCLWGQGKPKELFINEHNQIWFKVKDKDMSFNLSALLNETLHLNASDIATLMYTGTASPWRIEIRRRQGRGFAEEPPLAVIYLDENRLPIAIPKNKRAQKTFGMLDVLLEQEARVKKGRFSVARELLIEHQFDYEKPEDAKHLGYGKNRFHFSPVGYGGIDKYTVFLKRRKGLRGISEILVKPKKYSIIISAVIVTRKGLEERELHTIKLKRTKRPLGSSRGQQRCDLLKLLATPEQGEITKKEYEEFIEWYTPAAKRRYPDGRIVPEEKPRDNEDTEARQGTGEEDPTALSPADKKAKVTGNEVDPRSSNAPIKKIPPGSPLMIFLELLKEDRFFTESELCMLLGISIATLRPAFRRLEMHLGLVSSKPVGEETAYRLLSKAREYASRLTEILKVSLDKHGAQPKIPQLREIQPLVNSAMGRSSVHHKPRPARIQTNKKEVAGPAGQSGAFSNKKNTKVTWMNTPKTDYVAIGGFNYVYLRSYYNYLVKMRGLKKIDGLTLSITYDLVGAPYLEVYPHYQKDIKHGVPEPFHRLPLDKETLLLLESNGSKKTDPRSISFLKKIEARGFPIVLPKSPTRPTVTVRETVYDMNGYFSRPGTPSLSEIMLVRRKTGPNISMIEVRGPSDAVDPDRDHNRDIIDWLEVDQDGMPVLRNKAEDTLVLSKKVKPGQTKASFWNALVERDPSILDRYPEIKTVEAGSNKIQVGFNNVLYDGIGTYLEYLKNFHFINNDNEKLLSLEFKAGQKEITITANIRVRKEKGKYGTVQRFVDSVDLDDSGAPAGIDCAERGGTKYIYLITALKGQDKAVEIPIAANRAFWTGTMGCRVDSEFLEEYIHLDISGIMLFAYSGKASPKRIEIREVESGTFYPEKMPLAVLYLDDDNNPFYLSGNKAGQVEVRLIDLLIEQDERIKKGNDLPVPENDLIKTQFTYESREDIRTLKRGADRFSKGRPLFFTGMKAYVRFLEDMEGIGYIEEVRVTIRKKEIELTPVVRTEEDDPLEIKRMHVIKLKRNGKPFGAKRGQKGFGILKVLTFSEQSLNGRTPQIDPKKYEKFRRDQFMDIRHLGRAKKRKTTRRKTEKKVPPKKEPVHTDNIIRAAEELIKAEELTNLTIAGIIIGILKQFKLNNPKNAELVAKVIIENGHFGNGNTDFKRAALVFALSSIFGFDGALIQQASALRMKAIREKISGLVEIDPRFPPIGKKAKVKEVREEVTTDNKGTETRQGTGEEDPTIAASIKQTLSLDNRRRPEPEDVAELSEEDIIALAKQDPNVSDEAIKNILESKTMLELENVLPYLDRTVKTILKIYPDDTILVAGRDAETLYDALKTVLRGSPREDDVKLLPVSGNLLENMEEPYSLDQPPLALQERFFASFGITDETINSGKRFVIIDTGFEGTVRMRVLRLLTNILKNKVPSNSISSAIDIALIGANDKRFRFLELTEFDLERDELSRKFPKTMAVEGVDKLTGNFCIAAVLQLLPHFHGQYYNLREEEDGTVSAIAGRPKTLSWDIDHASKVNGVNVNPFAAMIIQKRVVEYFRQAKVPVSRGSATNKNDAGGSLQTVPEALPIAVSVTSRAVSENHYYVHAEEASDLVRDLARQLGFDAESTRKLANLAHEMVTNILEFGNKGVFEARSKEKNGRIGIELTAQDEGPGMANPEAVRRQCVKKQQEAFTDGVLPNLNGGLAFNALSGNADEASIDSQGSCWDRDMYGTFKLAERPGIVKKGMRVKAAIYKRPRHSETTDEGTEARQGTGEEDPEKASTEGSDTRDPIPGTEKSTLDSRQTTNSTTAFTKDDPEPVKLISTHLDRNVSEALASEIRFQITPYIVWNALETMGFDNIREMSVDQFSKTLAAQLDVALCVNRQEERENAEQRFYETFGYPLKGSNKLLDVIFNAAAVSYQDFELDNGIRMHLGNKINPVLEILGIKGYARVTAIFNKDILNAKNAWKKHIVLHELSEAIAQKMYEIDESFAVVTMHANLEIIRLQLLFSYALGGMRAVEETVALQKSLNKTDKYKDVPEFGSMNGVFEDALSGKLFAEYGIDTSPSTEARQGTGEEDPDKLHKLAASDLEHLLNEGNFAIISTGPNLVERKDLTSEQELVAKRYKDMRSELEAIQGVELYDVMGRDDMPQEERGFLVVKDDTINESEFREALLNISKAFSQDSVSFLFGGNNEIAFSNGDPSLFGQGYRFVEKNADFYTAIALANGKTVRMVLNVIDPAFEETPKTASTEKPDTRYPIPGTNTDPLIYDMSEAEGVAAGFRDKLLSILTKKKVVLLFEDGIGDANSSMILDVLEEIERLKKDPKYARFLRNLTVKKASGKKIARTVNKYTGADTEVFVFARNSTREDLKKIESRVHSTYIDEKDYDWNMYYPLAEMVTIALSQYIDPRTMDKIKDLLEELNIAAELPSGGTIVFTLLPAMERYDKQYLIQKYAALKRALIAA